MIKGANIWAKRTGLIFNYFSFVNIIHIEGVIKSETKDANIWARQTGLIYKNCT